MQNNNENNTSNSLVPLNSRGLVRLGNSIALTDKILKESAVLYNQFEGKLCNKIPINQEEYFEFATKISNEIYLLNKLGNILKIDIQIGAIVEIETIYNFLDAKYPERGSNDIFYNYQKIMYYSVEANQVYIANQTNDYLLYDINKDLLINRELIQNAGKDDIIQYWAFLPFDNFIFSFCEEWIATGIDVELDGAYKIKNFIRVLSKNNLELIRRFEAIENFYYFQMKNSNGFLYALNEYGLEEYMGKILKQHLNDDTYSFLNAFTNNWVEEYEILEDNTIICYANYILGNNDSLLRIIDSINNEIIFEIGFAEIIRRIALSDNESVLSLLFNDGKVHLYNIKHREFELIKKFQYMELIVTDHEVTPIHFNPPHIFEFISNKLVIGNRKQINIYN